jgi:hypothetical protein
MTDMPERIWATEFTGGERSWTDNPEIGKYRQEGEYVHRRTVHSQIDAAVAAALGEAASAADKRAAWWGAEWGNDRTDRHMAGLSDGAQCVANDIRALIPADAQAALDRMLAEARADALLEAAQAIGIKTAVATGQDWDTVAVASAQAAILALIPKGAAHD